MNFSSTVSVVRESLLYAVTTPPTSRIGTKHVTSEVRTTFRTSASRLIRWRTLSKRPHAAPPAAVCR